MVKYVLIFLTMDSTAPHTQEQALENHADLMDSNTQVHDRLDNIEKMLDPTETASMIMGMPEKTGLQIHEKMKAMRKNKNRENDWIAEHKQTNQNWLAETRRLAAEQTVQMAERVSDAVDYVLPDNATIEECRAYQDHTRVTSRAAIKLAGIKISKLKKDEKIIDYCLSSTM
jgi:hypothetical protein